MIFIRSEDMAVVFVGPFPSREAAEQHMDRFLPIYRKTESGYSDTIVDITPTLGDTVITPEQDAQMWEEN